jgi:hypothetical protein
MSILAALGNVLDVPGSMARDALMLRNPIDQLADPFGQSGRTSGQEMLDMVGMRNSPLLSMALEMGLDPTTYIGYGAAMKGAKALGLVGDGFSLADKAKKYGKAAYGAVRHPYQTIDSMAAAPQMLKGRKWRKPWEMAGGASDNAAAAAARPKYSMRSVNDATTRGASATTPPARTPLSDALDTRSVDVMGSSEGLKNFDGSPIVDFASPDAVAAYERAAADAVSAQNAKLSSALKSPKMQPRTIDDVARMVDEAESSGALSPRAAELMKRQMGDATESMYRKAVLGMKKNLPDAMDGEEARQAESLFAELGKGLSRSKKSMARSRAKAVADAGPVLDDLARGSVAMEQPMSLGQSLAAFGDVPENVMARAEEMARKAYESQRRASAMQTAQMRGGSAARATRQVNASLGEGLSSVAPEVLSQLPAEAKLSILSRLKGNPLYNEDLMRMLIGAGLPYSANAGRSGNPYYMGE